MERGQLYDYSRSKCSHRAYESLTALCAERISAVYCVRYVRVVALVVVADKVTENPDIVCLQETKVAETKFKSDVLSGYEAYFYSCKSNPGYAGE